MTPHAAFAQMQACEKLSPCQQTYIPADIQLNKCLTFIRLLNSVYFTFPVFSISFQDVSVFPIGG